MSADSLTLLNDLIAAARRAGADAADAVLIGGTALSLAQRLGEPERLERAENTDIGLRVLIGRRQAIVSSSDTRRAALDELVERAVAMAENVPEDPYCGLADPDQIATSVPDLDICDSHDITAETLKDWSLRTEDAARAVPGVTNSEGAEASWSRTRIALAASNGFAQAYARSSVSFGVSVLAGTGTAMERDYDFTSAVYAEDLLSPEAVGRAAGEKAVKRLNPRKMPTVQVPVVYDPRAGRSLIGHLAGAISGGAVARGTTFLRKSLNTPLFAETIRVIDDPRRTRGLGSRPFDGEGLPAEPLDIVERGVLKTWLLDLRSARQLGLASNGRAARGVSSPPGPSTTNLYLDAGTPTPGELYADVKSGFYVTELIGMGVNTVTGDYSRGASGFWIENGALAFPVSEVTIAGNLKDMFATLSAANDLEFRYATNTPTVRIEGMTVAGQ
ncbi:MAG: TldD/PmbA family protein [Rhodospirillales bacterium]